MTSYYCVGEGACSCLPGAHKVSVTSHISANMPCPVLLNMAYNLRKLPLATKCLIFCISVSMLQLGNFIKIQLQCEMSGDPQPKPTVSSVRGERGQKVSSEDMQILGTSFVGFVID